MAMRFAGHLVGTGGSSQTKSNGVPSAEFAGGSTMEVWIEWAMIPSAATSYEIFSPSPGLNL